MAQHPNLLSTPAAAARLGCTAQSVRRYVSEGTLEGIRVGGRVKVLEASVDALLKTRIGAPKP